MTKAYLSDMDGVLVRGSTLVPGADGFIRRLQRAGAPFLVLTNNSIYTPHDLQARLHGIGLEVPVEAIFTSAMATAAFLKQQRPCGRAYALGEQGLKAALREIVYALTDQGPDYVVLGETRTTASPRSPRPSGSSRPGRASSPPTPTSTVPATAAWCPAPGRWRR